MAAEFESKLSRQSAGPDLYDYTNNPLSISKMASSSSAGKLRSQDLREQEIDKVLCSDEMTSSTTFDSPNHLDSSDFNAMFQAFELNGDADDDTEMQSETSSNFKEEGRTFWMKFLDAKESESQSTEDSQAKMSFNDRGITQSWPVDSPLSGCGDLQQQSMFSKGTQDSVSFEPEDDNGMIEVDDGWKSSYRNGANGSYAEDPFASVVARRSKSSALFTSPSSEDVNATQSAKTQQTQPRDHMTYDTTAPVSQFSFTSPPPAASQQTYTLPLVPSSSPRIFGEDVTNRSSNPEAANGSAGMSESLDHLTESETNEVCSRKTSRSSVGRLTPSTSSLDDQNLFGHGNLSKGGPTPTMTKGLFVKSERKSPVEGSNNQIRKTTNGDLRAAPVVFGKMQIVKISARPELRHRFQWAYDRWHQAGLMRKVTSPRESIGTPTYESPPNPLSSGEKRFKVEEVGTTAVDDNGISDGLKEPKRRTSNGDELSGSRTNSGSDVPGVRTTEVDERDFQTPRNMERGISTTNFFVDDLLPDIDAVPSGESDQSSFQDLLRQWRDKSDDKPNTHFLSPDHDLCNVDSKSFDTISSKDRSVQRDGPWTTSKLEKGKTIQTDTRLTPAGTKLVSQRIEEYDRDYFDFVRDGSRSASPGDDKVVTGPEQHSNEKKDSPKNASTQNQESSRIGRSATFGDDQPAGEMKEPPQVVDSDMFEDINKVEEPTDRAVISLDNKEITELDVESKQVGNGSDLVVRNLELVNLGKDDALTEYSPCQCSGSIFSGNDDLISFFLPQMGMACTCGKQRRGPINLEEPTAIENILRPWQVKFLKSFGIDKGEQLVKARHRSADTIAKSLRQWRKNEGMKSFKTSACGMAIDIWAKTCKSYVRSVRKQLKEGNGHLDHQPGVQLEEFGNFLRDLPAEPKRKAHPTVEIELDSQVEV